MPHYRSRGPRRRNYYNTWVIPRGWGPLYVKPDILYYDNPYIGIYPRRRYYWFW